MAPSAITGSYTIPDSVTNIGQSAFEGCSRLTNIVIPESITVIGVYTFKGCSSLSSIVIPRSVTEIYYGAFSYCSNLTSIVIPKNVSYIASDAFSYCSKLTGIHVDKNNLYYSSDEQGVLFDKEKTELIKAPGAIMGSYIIPDSVTNIGQCAFEGCSNLTSIDIPNSVTDIEYMAFSNCSKLTGIHVDNSNLHYFSDNWGVLFDKEKTILIEAPGAITGSYAIPGSTTSISWYAFKDCTRLTSIEIPDSVTVMGCDSFASCTSLNSIYFKGDAPDVYHDYADVSFETAFFGVTASFYYPAGNPTWTTEVMVDSHGAFTWIGYNPNGTFYDVEMSSWYENPVEWAVTNSITSGTSSNKFSPYDSCLRSQVVTFLWRAAGEPKAESAVNPFVDVKSIDYYYDAVLWAVEQGITTGADATHFEPNGVYNRSQVVTFLYRAFNKPPVSSSTNPFTDVSTGDWYASAVLWAVQEGITNGLSDTQFGPNDVCDRSQVVTFLYRAYN